MKLFLSMGIANVQIRTLVSIGIISQDGKKFYGEKNLDSPYDKYHSFIDIDPNYTLIYLDKDDFWNFRSGNINIKSNEYHIGFYLEKWLEQFDNVEIVTHLAEYDMMFFYNLFGGRSGLPKNAKNSPQRVNCEFEQSLTEIEKAEKLRANFRNEVCKYDKYKCN